MKIRATISVELQRADGSRTTISETVEEDAGDNPRFEGRETKLLLDHVGSIVLDRLPDSGVEPLNGSSLSRLARR